MTTRSAPRSATAPAPPATRQPLGAAVSAVSAGSRSRWPGPAGGAPRRCADHPPGGGSLVLQRISSAGSSAPGASSPHHPQGIGRDTPASSGGGNTLDHASGEADPSHREEDPPTGEREPRG